MNNSLHTVLVLCPEDALRSSFTEKLNLSKATAEVKSIANAMQALLEMSKKNYSLILVAMSGVDIKSLNLVHMIQQNSPRARVCVFNNDIHSAGTAIHISSRKKPAEVIREIFSVD